MSRALPSRREAESGRFPGEPGEELLAAYFLRALENPISRLPGLARCANISAINSGKASFPAGTEGNVMMQPKDNEIKPNGGRPLTLRAVLLGMILLPVNAYFLTQLEIVRYDAFPSTFGLMMNSLFVLLILAAFNLILVRWFPRRALSAGELITIYVMLNIGTVVAGEDYFQVVMYNITYPFYRAMRESGWGADIIKYLPHWMYITDPEALRGFHLGGTSLFSPKIFRAWLVPMLVWGGCLMVFFWIMLCINVILRKQWTERERLTFPLVQVPLAIVSGPSFFRNKILWAGIAVSSFIALFNGLNFLFPMIPAAIPQGVRVFNINFSQDYPWKAIAGSGGVNGRIMPYGIALSMLMPTDLAFSCWFFFWVQRAEEVISAVFGYTGAGQPYVTQQSAGALIGVSLFIIWNERRYLLAVLRKALGLTSELDDSQEPLSYRTAVFGILLGIIALSVLSWKAGLSLRIFWAFLFIYFIIAIGVTRLRAELGTPVHDLYAIGPQFQLMNIFGINAFSKRDVALQSSFYFLSRQYGSHPMPAQLEGFKMAERTGLNPRRFSWVMLAAGGVGTIAAFLVMAGMLHRLGSSTTNVIYDFGYFGKENFNDNINMWKASPDPNISQVAATAGGMIFCLILLAVRLQVANFPFHPLGFALGGSYYMMTTMWSCIFLGWMIKVLLLRYGGQRAYLRSLPFFFGLIIGDCVWGVIWLTVGVFLHRTMYSVWFPLT
jgi:hypothetical protein